MECSKLEKSERGFCRSEVFVDVECSVGDGAGIVSEAGVAAGVVGRLREFRDTPYFYKTQNETENKRDEVKKIYLGSLN